MPSGKAGSSPLRVSMVHTLGDGHGAFATANCATETRT